MQPFDTTWKAAAVRLAVLLLVMQGLPCRAQTAGSVAVLERAQGDVEFVRAGVSMTAALGSDLQRRDRVTTGATSRAAILFPDGSRLALGANAEAVVEDFLPENGRQRATIMLEVPSGAFRLSLTPSKSSADKHVVVRTRGTTLAVKATDIWVGPLDEGIGVLAIAGKVHVRTAAGSLVLDRKRQGTLLRSPAINPDKPAIWSRDQTERALTVVAFD